MKKIALMRQLWEASVGLPVPQVKALLVDATRPPVHKEIEQRIRRLATDSADVKKQRQAAQKRKQKRGY